MKKKIVGILICTLLIVATAIPISGNVLEKDISKKAHDRGTLYVGGSGPNNYSTIQEGINAANPGDTVFVFDDSAPYYEHVVVDKAINLIGEDKETTIINGGGSGDVVRITANWVNMSEFTTTGCGAVSTDAGIELNNVQNCHIENNKCIDQYTGIYLYYSTNNLIEDNNCSSNLWPGFYIVYSNWNTMKNNICLSNSRSFYSLYSDNNIIDNNICSSNTEYGIFLASQCDNNMIANNTCPNNAIGICIGSACDNNIINGNIISSNSLRGIFLSSNNNNLVYNNYFSNNPINAMGDGNNKWNITKTPGINILGGAYLGGNYWDDYNGTDNDGDGLGDTNLPYNCFGNINGGDWRPLVNIPPYPPSSPNPWNGSINVMIDINLSWTGGDPDPGNTVTYDVYFGTTSPPPQIASNQSDTTYDPGMMNHNTLYYWMIVAWDNHDASTSGPIWNFATEDKPNNPPDAPIINGPTSGVPGEMYSYTFVSEDPDGDDVYYEIDWGDGTVDPWDGPHESNKKITRSHSWDSQGTFTIMARTKDIHDAISGWGTLDVTMPRNRAININYLFLKFLGNHPNMFPILRYLLGL